MTATPLAIIGGTGLNRLQVLENSRVEHIDTPFGEPSAPLTHGILYDNPVVFLPRHGEGHTVAPHKVNYRANLWALNVCGVKNIVAIAAVGGIHPEISPSGLVFPDQIIDYTWSRDHTYFEDVRSEMAHIDFTRPYCETLRMRLIEVAREADLGAREFGTYAATQGPRLETAAEIDRLERDGCDIVGMTGMPEAALARELGICYATCAVCANRAAGRSESGITMAEIHQNLSEGMKRVLVLLRNFIRSSLVSSALEDD